MPQGMGIPEEQEFKVEVLGQSGGCQETVPSSGPRHVAHLGEPQELPSPTKAHYAFNILRLRLPETTPYAEFQRAKHLDTCGDGHHLLRIRAV